MVDPLPIPALCEIPWDSVECWQALDSYDQVTHANTEIAQGNADNLRDAQRAYDAILHAAKLQQQIARIREEQLQMERDQTFWDLAWHRAIIVALGAGLAL